MNPLLEEVAIGAVIRGAKLTAVVRRSSTLLPAKTIDVETAESAAHALQWAKYKLRQDGSCDPCVYLLDAPDTVPHPAGVMELLRRHDTHTRDAIVDGRSAAVTCSPTGTPYANRRSELIDEFLRKMHAKDLLLPVDPDLSRQLIAFQVEERESGIFYPSPTDVANAIGEYPAVFLAALMASIAAVPPPRWDEAQPLGYDPITSLLDG